LIFIHNNMKRYKYFPLNFRADTIDILVKSRWVDKTIKLKRDQADYKEIRLNEDRQSSDVTNPGLSVTVQSLQEICSFVPVN